MDLLHQRLVSTHEPVTVLVVLETVENKTEGGLCS